MPEYVVLRHPVHSSTVKVMIGIGSEVVDVKGGADVHSFGIVLEVVWRLLIKIAISDTFLFDAGAPV